MIRSSWRSKSPPIAPQCQQSAVRPPIRPNIYEPSFSRNFSGHWAMREVSYDREGTACQAEPGPGPGNRRRAPRRVSARAHPDALSGNSAPPSTVQEHACPERGQFSALGRAVGDRARIRARSWPAFAARVRHLEAAGSTSPREMLVVLQSISDVETDELSCALTREERRAITARRLAVRIDRP